MSEVDYKSCFKWIVLLEVDNEFFFIAGFECGSQRNVLDWDISSSDIVIFYCDSVGLGLNNISS